MTTALLLALCLTGVAVACRTWDFVPRMTVREDRDPVAPLT